MQRVGEPPSHDAGCDAVTLLSLWERGVSLADVDRADSLLQALDVDASRPLTLGARTVRLLDLHARLFGPHADLVSHCPACGAQAQFAVDCTELAAQIHPGDPVGPHSLSVDGLEIAFRLPTSADVATASNHSDEEAFVHRLLEQCVLACSRHGEAVAPHAWPPAIVDALSNRIESLDPGANVSFALQCPGCEAHWRAPLDCGRLVWQKVQAAAERLLLDIDALARAYGWTEPDVLALSPIRRAAYVQMIAS
jgi:hypothetical protein